MKGQVQCGNVQYYMITPFIIYIYLKNNIYCIINVYQIYVIILYSQQVHLCVTAYGLYYLYDKRNAKLLTYRIRVEEFRILYEM